MNKIWIIAKKEVKGYFSSLLAYILMIIFFGLTGYFVWMSPSNVFFVDQANLDMLFGLFRIPYWLLILFIPAITMRMFAEENKSGTIELLLTKPVSDWQVIAGKFLASLLLIAVIFLLTLPYYITVASIGPIDHSSVLIGYLGMLLISSAYISIGLFASSITNNQIVSFLISIVIILIFHLFFFISRGLEGVLGSIFDYLSIPAHYDSITRGVIDSQNVFYFLSIILIGLLSTEYVLSRRNHVE
jgi:ABC-2 type transport system permease protein